MELLLQLGGKLMRPIFEVLFVSFVPCALILKYAYFLVDHENS